MIRRSVGSGTPGGPPHSPGDRPSRAIDPADVKVESYDELFMMGCGRRMPGAIAAPIGRHPRMVSAHPRGSARLTALARAISETRPGNGSLEVEQRVCKIVGHVTELPGGTRTRWEDAALSRRTIIDMFTYSQNGEPVRPDTEADRSSRGRQKLELLNRSGEPRQPLPSLADNLTRFDRTFDRAALADVASTGARHSRRLPVDLVSVVVLLEPKPGEVVLTRGSPAFYLIDPPCRW